MNSLFPIEINILDFIFKGIVIGIIASAPMGPVGILCIQRTLNKGRWYGFVTGIGAACSDIVYAMFTGLGMSFVMDFVNNAQNKFYLQISGSLLLLVFGVYCFKSNPMKNMHKSSNKQGTLFHNGLTAFLVTLSNPLIVFLFMATYAQFAFVVPDMPIRWAWAISASCLAPCCGGLVLPGSSTRYAASLIPMAFLLLIR